MMQNSEELVECSFLFDVMLSSVVGNGNDCWQLDHQQPMMCHPGIIVFIIRCHQLTDNN